MSDKRLLVIEQEFASTLRVLNREGNTLSAILRQAWDGGTLRTLAKNSPMKATGAHISVIGHITCDELLRHLHDTEAGNGFGNRFLWVCVRRSKELPEGGSLDRSDLNALVVHLNKAVTFARDQDEIRRDERARKLWRDVYHDLSEARPGLLGHMVARAEAHVMRLSGLYALLDQSPLITIEHLDAALAVWRYCEASARYIFGDALGDPIADDILQVLQARAPRVSVEQRSATTSGETNRLSSSRVRSGSSPSWGSSNVVSRKPAAEKQSSGTLRAYATKQTNLTKERTSAEFSGKSHVRKKCEAAPRTGFFRRPSMSATQGL